MRALSLFSGIGGLDLAAERAGMTIAAQVEIDPFCRKVLAKHWPGVPCYDDVRTLDAVRLAADGITDIGCIFGGFPCQDISTAGNHAGISGTRSGLWSEFARLIGELRPGYAVVENVSALLHRGMDRVLGDLSEIGYDAEWSIISACAVGAPHTRERLCIVAYPHGINGEAWVGNDALRTRKNERQGDAQRAQHWMESYSGVRGISYGIPARVDRLRALGNAVVPQVFQPIFAAIMATKAVAS